MRKISPKLIGLTLMILSMLAFGGITIQKTLAEGSGFGPGDVGTGGGG